MNSKLATLENLAYIIECAALEYFGAGKTELQRLADHIRCAESDEFEDNDIIADALEKALELLRRQELKAGTSLIIQINRKLWTKILSEFKGEQLCPGSQELTMPSEAPLSGFFDSNTEEASFFKEALPSLLYGTAYELQGMFQPEELMVIVRAMRDAEIVPYEAGTILSLRCEKHLRLKRERKVNIPIFLNKISRLSAFQTMYLEIWAKRYWDNVSNGIDGPIEYYVGALQKADKAFLH